MKAHYFISLLTDLVRKNHEPLIKEPCKDLCSDYEDFMFSAYLRFVGIKAVYPTAEFVTADGLALIFVDGVEVYRKELIYIDPDPVEVTDDETGDEN